MIYAAILSFLLTGLSAVFGFEFLAITFGTTCYHFSMRLAVGYTLNHRMHNKADYRKCWYQLQPFEKRLYQILKVKK